MHTLTIPVTEFQQHCTLLWCEKTMEGAVVDPGGYIDLIIEAVETKGIKLQKVLLTHGHLDHVGAVADLAQRYGIPIEGPHRDEQSLIAALPQQCVMFGFPPVKTFTPDRWLVQGDTVSFGQQTLEVLHCPGHTLGHVVFFHRGDKLALVGDVLFQGSIGRTDLPGGNHAQLLDSIRSRLWPLGDEVSFIPGHGPRSTFGEERKSNPFVGDRFI